jgi:hypothetical protein
MGEQIEISISSDRKNTKKVPPEQAVQNNLEEGDSVSARINHRPMNVFECT